MTHERIKYKTNRTNIKIKVNKLVQPEVDL